MGPLLEVRGLRRDVAGRTILTGISFSLEQSEILFVRGPSGIGKSLLLRALACLDPIQSGCLLLHGQPPAQVGYPAWRTRVAYVPQSRATSLKGTPAELYFQAQRFAAQRCRPRGDLPALVHALGLEQGVLHQQWGELSGGQSARCALALAVALGPEVLLLDEPTAACDAASALRVEAVLRTCGAACVWVTHDPHQPGRLGGRVLDLPLGTLAPLPPPPPPPGARSPASTGGAGAGAAAGSMRLGGGGGGPPGLQLYDREGSGLLSPAELLPYGEGEGELLSPDGPLSPPSPAAGQLLRASRGPP